MKLSQTGTTTAFAVLLAAALVLFGRLAATPTNEPKARSLSLHADARIAYLSYSGRDRIDVVVAAIDEYGLVRQTSQQRVRLHTIMPRIELSNNGLILTHESTAGLSQSTVRHLYDYSVQLNFSHCQHAALSPDGRTFSCSNVEGVFVSGVQRVAWRHLLENTADVVYGAPSIFNETLVVPRSNATHSELVVVSLQDESVLMLLDEELSYAFNRAGTLAAAALEDQPDSLVVVNVLEQTQDTHPLPAALMDRNVRVVALSDDGQKVLLYASAASSCGSKMAILDLDTQALTWLSVLESDGHTTGEFNADAALVTFAVGSNVYIATVNDGRAYWVGRGIRPTWITR
jgi:hypothetical protein